MINAIFKPLDTEVYTNPAKQWDYGQTLRIQGVTLPKAVEVHFGISGEENTVLAIGVTDGDYTDVEMPDGLLRQPNNLVAYVYIADVEKGNTVKTINIPVIARAKPMIPHTPEDEAVFREAIEAVNTAADRAEKAGQAATEAAGQAAEDAQQTAEDRKEVAKMVETVSGISEQVKKVEELSQKAQEAATKAGKSEQAADGFKTQAESAKKGAEAAAVKTAEDKTAVDNAKTEVLEAKTEVNADRTVVEQVKNEVEQLGGSIAGAVQSGVQEITQAGTAQKTAVEAAGTQAVESVENVKASATEAVETVKTEAIQAVQEEGTTQTGNVTTEGTKQVKAVQDKGNEVLQSIPEDFQMQMESKLDKQQGVENKGKALVIGEDGNVVPEEVASGGGDGIAIINTMSGESPLVIPDSAERVNKGLELGGKTDQVQTTGKNLLDEKLLKTLSNYTSNGLDYYYYRISGLEVGKKYTVSRGDVKTGKGALLGISVNQESTNKAKFLVYDGLGTSYNNASITWEQTTGEYVDILFSVAGGVTSTTQERLSEFWGRISYVQLEKGSTATPYEPYTGGKPSPSPEYPQEIKNSGKWNEETQKYEVEVVLSGKNLFDFSTCEEGKVFEGSGNIISAANGLLTDFIPCFPNSQYSRSRTGSTVVAFYDCDKNKIGFEIVGNTTFVTPEKCRYFRFSALKTIVDYTKIVACPGQTVMDYEPYREPKFFTLTLNKPLRGIGEMKDELSESGILRRVKSITLNGSEKWHKYENSAFVAMNCYGLKIDDLEVKNYNLTTLCNYLKWAKFPQDVESQSAHGGYIYFTVPKETCLDLESFKEWLAKNTPVLEYRLKEPVLEELSEEDKASIRALKTYYPTTVITADGGELDPDIKVTYTADTKNYIDNKVSAKVASIIRQYRLNTANLLSLMPMETQAAMIENDTNNILENAEEMKHE